MISLENQYRIDDILRQENLLTNEDLIAELTDHYSVALEDRLGQGVNAETALLAINTDFGRRSGLQKLEKQYNRVSFRRYDALWWEAMRLQFRPKKLLFLVGMWALVGYSSWQSPELNFDQMYGFFAGLSVGCVLAWQLPLWEYLKKLVRYGWHNPPAELQYLLSWSIPILATFFLLGQWMVDFAPVFPWLSNFTFSATYIMLLLFFLFSQGRLYNLLYKKDDDFIWD